MKKKHLIILAVIAAAAFLVWYFWDSIKAFFSGSARANRRVAIDNLINQYSELSNQRSASSAGSLQAVADKLKSYGITLLPHGSPPPSNRIFCCTSGDGGHDIYVGTWYGIWGGCRRVPGCNSGG